MTDSNTVIEGTVKFRDGKKVSVSRTISRKSRAGVVRPINRPSLFFHFSFLFFFFSIRKSIFMRTPRIARTEWNSFDSGAKTEITKNYLTT